MLTLVACLKKRADFYENIDLWKMNIFRFLPLSFLTIMLAVTFGSSFGDKFMYQHAMKAPDEMRELHKQFYAYMKKMKKCGCKAKRYSDWRKKHEK